MKTQFSQHTEWLSLIDRTGPFLAVGCLEGAFPQGLDKTSTTIRQRVRAAYDEWREAVDSGDTQIDALHREWLRLVFHELLEYDDAILKATDSLPDALSYKDPLSGDVVRPDFAVMAVEKARIVVLVLPPDSDPNAPARSTKWSASPIERMTALCRATGVEVGIVTDGERWVVVGVPKDGTSSLAVWHARIWNQEPITLQAFQSLLTVRRCFGEEAGTLDELLRKSLEHQDEVTDTLGEQVRRAVEVLVQALDRADEDRNRELLKDISEPQLYEAGLTVMMRLVFLMCAEERGLLLLGEPVYDQFYAVTTLRARLREDADRLGLEVLDRRQDAWSRLLATFRAVHGGIEHETLRLPALGGSLFDPDRYPFLEGRASGTSWKDTPAMPLPIDNRTVLLLLTALQVLEQSSGAQLLSYQALDVEQIGHVYEGLLERTVKRVPEITLGLQGTAKVINPNASLSEVESVADKGEDVLASWVKEQTGRNVKRALSKAVEADERHLLLHACGGDGELAKRIEPLFHLLRTDSWGEPIIYRAGSFVVTMGQGRRETGTHYTPKSLTEPIVQHALEPLVYVGPAEGKPQNEWKIKAPADILALKVCDMAMGSAAFLVQACRWMAERLTEAWAEAEAEGKAISIEGEVLERTGGCETMPEDRSERLLLARRLIASRCLYGVDINPMAVELAKLSLWLVTMLKNRPFNFLDHALKCGDSLLGVSNIKQLENFSIRAPDTDHPLFDTASLWRHTEEATRLRRQLESLPSHTAEQIAEKARLHADAESLTCKLKAAADFLVAAELDSPDEATWQNRRVVTASQMREKWMLDERDFRALGRNKLNGRRAFHWPIEFSEVADQGGFNAFLGNPPYLFRSGRDSLFQKCFHTAVGDYDLCWLFTERAAQLGDPKTRSFSLGFVLPESILFRDMPAPFRKWVVRNLKGLTAIHYGAMFGATVSVFALFATRSQSKSGLRYLDARDPSIDFRLEPEDLELDPSLKWIPSSRQSFSKFNTFIGDLLTLRQGEAIGKKALGSVEMWGSMCDPVVVLTGENFLPFLQPTSSYVMERAMVHKKKSQYASPKILIRKTGRRLVAALDTNNHVALQSLYCARLSGRHKYPLEFFLALLNSDFVNKHFIETETSKKAQFPQINQGLITAIPVPDFDQSQVDSLVGLVNRILSNPSETSACIKEIERLVTLAYKQKEEV